MANYIDVDALLDEMEVLYRKREEESYYSGNRVVFVSWNDAIFLVKTAPTIDAVEVTRCKDCKYALEDGSDPTRFWCSYKWPAFMVPDNGFCFRGDAKE